MSQPIKTPKNAYVLIAAGFGLGAVCMAGLFNSAAMSPAYAQKGGLPMRTIAGASTESMAELRNLDSSYTNLVDFVSPAVVDIHSETSRRMGANGERMPIAGGEGSGFIFRSDGYIITNDHVVGGFDKVTVTLKDGHDYVGKVTRAEDSDIAIVKIEAKDLPTLALADSSRVRPGQMVMAVGAPFGLEQTVTFGHVSALGRESAIQNKLYPDLIQTDASINMGNSGGPLVNIDGQVVGVNTSILSPSGVSAGIGFAIPANQVKFIADMLVSKGKITRSMLGLIPENLKEYEKAEKKLEGGAVVKEIPSEGPAFTAGIQKGDIIVKIGSTPIRSQLDLRNAMLIYAPGTTVPVELIRDGDHKTIDVKLIEAKRPAAPKSDSNDDGQFSIPKGFELPKGFEMPKGFERFKDGPGFQLPNRDGNGDDSNDGFVLPDSQPRLGVMVGDLSDQSRKEYGIPSSAKGAVVGQVLPNSLAGKAGLKSGDVIVRFGDKTVTAAKDLTDAIQSIKWGDSRTIKFLRYTKNGSVAVEKTVDFKRP